MLLRGEAGLGKTRLLDEVLTGCADFRLSHATSETFTAMLYLLINIVVVIGRASSRTPGGHPGLHFREVKGT